MKISVSDDKKATLKPFEATFKEIYISISIK
jgi:hypothetical protein